MEFVETGSEVSSPTAGTRFFRASGHGNDYLVFEAGDAWELTPRAVRALCRRDTGVGSDGVVLLGGGQPFRLRIFNPDGSEAERSGNGLRIVAVQLARTGRGPVGEDFAVACGGDTVRLRVHGRPGQGAKGQGAGRPAEWDVSASMGTPAFGAAAVALDAEVLRAGAPDDAAPGDALVLPPEFGGHPFVPVSVGNPHCVVFLPEGADPTGPLLGELGPELSTHRAFARGVNVQLVAVEGPSAIRIGIWERGAGRTPSSGTSSCAAAAAAVRRGAVGVGPVEVRMEGGVFRVTVSDGGAVELRGPVREICEGELSGGFVAALRASG